jgi:hypothetical protein
MLQLDLFSQAPDIPPEPAPRDQGGQLAAALVFDDDEGYPIAVFPDDCPGLPLDLIELSADEICEGDWIGLDFAFDTGPQSDAQDAAASYLNRQCPDRLWRVRNASMLLIQFDSYAELGFNTKLYRRSIKRAFGFPRCQIIEDFDQEHEIKKMFGLAPSLPQRPPEPSQASSWTPQPPEPPPRKGADVEKHKALALQICEKLAIATHPTHGTGYVIHWRNDPKPCGVTVRGLLWSWSAEWRIISEAKP